MIKMELFINILSILSFAVLWFLAGHELYYSPKLQQLEFEIENYELDLKRLEDKLKNSEDKLKNSEEKNQILSSKNIDLQDKIYQIKQILDLI